MVKAPQETRAEIARSRLAELRANFDASLSDLEQPEPGRRRRQRSVKPVRLVHLRLVVTVSVAAAVLLTWWLLAGRPAEVALAPTAELRSAKASGVPAQSSGQQIVIDVAGKVRRPGIVTLRQGARVHEAIAAAGGLRAKADTTSLNLARILTDGEQILVGSPSAGSPVGSDAQGGAGAVQINLNTADAAALDTLPGVGPVTAEAIISWRTQNGPFRTVDDLLDVKGIGAATLGEIRDRVRI